MLIGIDGRPFYGSLAGTGRYVTELCRVLDRALPEARFLVYGNRVPHLPVSSGRWRHRRDGLAAAEYFPTSLWYFLRAGRLAQQDQVDVFWGPANFLPRDLGARIPAVLTVHDFVHALFPETLGTRHRLAYALFFRHSLSRAHLITCNSHGTAARLAALYGRRADLVVRPRAAESFRRPQPERIAQALARFGIDFPYFLSVATLEPRKNLETLIDAFLAHREGDELASTGLVLVGHAGWMTGRLAASAAKARAAGVPVRLIGYVPDAWLPALYAGAVAVVMPSLYEGFGMPVLEARCCGATVVASNIPEIREAGGEGPLYVEPTLEGIKSGLHLAASLPPSHSAEIVDRGTSWAAEGSKLVSAIRRLV